MGVGEGECAAAEHFEAVPRRRERERGRIVPAEPTTGGQRAGEPEPHPPEAAGG